MAAEDGAFAVLRRAAQALTDAGARNASGVALWDAEGDDEAFQKELDGMQQLLFMPLQQLDACVVRRRCR